MINMWFILLKIDIVIDSYNYFYQYSYYFLFFSRIIHFKKSSTIWFVNEKFDSLNCHEQKAQKLTKHSGSKKNRFNLCNFFTYVLSIFYPLRQWIYRKNFTCVLPRKLCEIRDVKKHPDNRKPKFNFFHDTGEASESLVWKKIFATVTRYFHLLEMSSRSFGNSSRRMYTTLLFDDLPKSYGSKEVIFLERSLKINSQTLRAFDNSGAPERNRSIKRGTFKLTSFDVY